MPADARSFPLPDSGQPQLPPAVDMGALGGPVRTLHRSIAHRLSEGHALAPLPVTLDERIIQAISRVAGPVLLVAGFIAVAKFIF